MDVALAIARLVPNAIYKGSLTDNTRAAFYGLVWEDERPRPTWTDLELAAGPTADDLRAAVAAERYRRETAGIAWQGFGIATDRESQQKMSDERNAVKDGLRADGKGWKCLDLATGVTVFRPTSNAEILDLAATAYRYVSDCFAREEELLAAIAAGTFSEDQLEIGWP